MDIVRILTFAHLKASFYNLKLKQKLFLQIFLFSLFLNLIPHITYAYSVRIKAPTASESMLIFDISDKSYEDLLAIINSNIATDKAQEKIRQQAIKQGELTNKVRAYLQEQGSPMANYADVLISVKNWKKIVALANAESSLCRNYITGTANCWGVGGATLWDFGNNLGDGILAMNKFLNTYPLKSKVKYAQMPFEQMNGLYKKPAAAHWLFNAESTYDDLVAIEQAN